MKNKISLFAIGILLSVVSISASAAGSSRTFEDYTITPVVVDDLSNGIDKAWVLAYDTNESPIVISFKKNKHCKSYIVRGDHFEVVYECSAKGFGARFVKNSESVFAKQLTKAVLNEQELERQRILIQGPIEEKRALALIAAFLPDLINPGYEHLLN